jgi:hypothetical protein
MLLFKAVRRRLQCRRRLLTRRLPEVYFGGDSQFLRKVISSCIVCVVCYGLQLRLREVAPHTATAEEVEVFLDQPLGSGHSGVVYGGLLRGRRVAIKSLVKKEEDDVDAVNSEEFRMKYAVMMPSLHFCFISVRMR